MTERRALGWVATGAAAALAWLALPFFTGLLLGTLMAFSLEPLYEWLARRTRRPIIASLVTVLISAVTIVAELGQVSRFESARQLMGYSGAVPSEHTSGQRQRRGSITKTGNAHLRRIAIEAAWCYRLRPAIGPALRKRQEQVPEAIKEIAWKAQLRLHKRYASLAAAGKDQRKIVTAVGRELMGFIWAIGVKVETAASQPIAA